MLKGRITAVVGGSSLLANSFNQLWIDALNSQEMGEDIKYFAMLHSDVIPDTGWLDVLYEDLLSSGADLVSAVVPIKDYLGMTSTAIDDPNDQFIVERRLTMTEVYTLPEIFTAADCGYPDRKLLANTGCWICRFDRPWRFAMNEDGTLKLRFTIADRIRRSRPNEEGKTRWEAGVASEDWNFSRDLQDLGGKVVCTRRVGLSHEGAIPYSNREPWGAWEFDCGLQHKFGSKRINSDLPFDFTMPQEIRGWLNETEGRALANLAKGKVVLEIGSFCGRSTVCLARSALKVYCVDPFDARTTMPKTEDTFEEFNQNLVTHNVADKVVVHRGCSTDYNMALPEMVDLVFIDGDHSYKSVKDDIQVAFKFLKPGGLIAFHDYQSLIDKGVTRAVDELLAQPGTIQAGCHGSIIVVRQEPFKTDARASA